jgi:exoribonuclease II
MNVFYEEDGAFKAGTVLADQGGACQVEAPGGRRTKVKATHVLVRFDVPAPAELMQRARELAETIDLSFLWECAPQDEFDFASLGADYFGHTPNPIESAALVTRLHGAPMYFYRKGRGRYRPAPPEALAAALAGQERRAQQAALQARYVAQLLQGHLPVEMAGIANELLFSPNKSSIESKALEEAASKKFTTPTRLLLEAGAFASPKDVHLQRFLCANFPHGTGFPDMTLPDISREMPVAGVEAFSIDDAQTTEIDDALSVVALEGGWRIGIHIAAPALAIEPGGRIDDLIREHYSTVYMPGDKITMMPTAVVDAYTLAAGRDCCAVSLYVDVDSDFEVQASHSRVEYVHVSQNLRHGDIEDLVTAGQLDAGEGAFPCSRELSILWRFAKVLNAGRQAARVSFGLRPEMQDRADYNFYVDLVDGVETIQIKERRRGSPLDVIVAEMMILANTTWGKLLADSGVSGIYRAQLGFGLAGRVRMLTYPAPHQGLGVLQYAWSTSPLRRYVDLVNQWQIIACIDGAKPAFENASADLAAVVAGFEAAYAAYAEFQANMERYWCLRWIEQNHIGHCDALVLREDMVRLVDIPLVVRIPGLPALPRRARVEIEMISVDYLDLSAQCRLVALIEEVDALEVEAEAEDQDAAAQ